MKVDVSKVFLDLRDEPIKMEGAVFTLASAMISSLLAQLESEKNISPDEKYKRYKLFRKIDECKDDKCDLLSDEITLIKDLIGKIYAPLIVGQAFDWLEGAQE